MAKSTRHHAPLLPLARSSRLIDRDISQNAFYRLNDRPPLQNGSQPHSGKENRPPRTLPLPRVLHRSKQIRLRISSKPIHSFDSILRPTRAAPCLSQNLTSQYLSSSSGPNVAKWINGTNFYDARHFWLILYFCFNLSLTLHNKVVLVRFPYPYTLTALHALCGSIGGHLLLKSGAFVPVRLCPMDTVALVAFSVLYAVNIIVSNVSLQMVNIPVIRAMTPLFTMIFMATLLGTQSSRARVTSLVPVIAGVALATYGDYDFTLSGLLLTLLGSMLAALKTIFTNVLQSSSKERFLRHSLHPLDLLIRMSPLAFVYCIFSAQASGELDRVHYYISHDLTLLKALGLVVNGTIAFGLNIVSFTANKKAGALSMAVAANVKQVLTILLAVVMFELKINWINGFGIFLALMGGGWYSMVECAEIKKMGDMET